MVAVPVLGYPSKRAAIWALIDEGLNDAQIAERVDTSEQSVYQARSEKRRANRLPTDKTAKAFRLYAATLQLIGEALGVEPETLHRSYSRLLFKDLSLDNLAVLERAGAGMRQIEPEAPPEPAAPSMSHPAAPTPAPTDKPAPAVPADRFTFTDGLGKYLRRDGSDLTDDLTRAYRGTKEQADFCAVGNKFARTLRMIPFPTESENHGG